MKKENKMRYHHIGIPTKVSKKGEQYIPEYKLYFCSCDKNEYGIEWMRYEDDCKFPEILKTKPHIAFEVDDVYEAVKGKKILVEPNSPAEGIVIAYIEEDGVPIEFLHINKAIAYCGLNCLDCEAYIATMKNDDKLRAKVAANWAQQYNAPVTAADINCTGCRSDGPKVYYCSNLCEIRKCARAKKLDDCSVCQEFPCANLREILQHAPQAKQNLLSRLG